MDYFFKVMKQRVMDYVIGPGLSASYLALPQKPPASCTVQNKQKFWIPKLKSLSKSYFFFKMGEVMCRYYSLIDAWI